jgi:hypothetical protein
MIFWLPAIAAMVQRGRARRLADIGFNRAERIVRRLRCCRFGQCIEQGGLAHIGESDDTAFKAHIILLGD